MPECSSPRCLPATRATQRSRPLVEAARRGVLSACATTGILSEVYAALTWRHAQPPHSPEQLLKLCGIQPRRSSGEACARRFFRPLCSGLFGNNLGTIRSKYGAKLATHEKHKARRINRMTIVDWSAKPLCSGSNPLGASSQFFRTMNLPGAAP